ncbi:MAG TPA: STAS domain-containing protein [Steroidobacteraceae bacterium]|nr:STAS domain-containing protein [Steroidobacteraceae bacterium]
MSRKRPPRAARIRTIVLQRRLSIAQSAELHGILCGSLAEGAPLRVDASQVEEIDTAILQLLASLWRTCAERGVECRWQGISDPVRRAAALIGMDATLETAGVAAAAGQADS